MTCTLKPGVRYRMPVVFGPAPGPRQHPDGRPWKPEETGVMNSEWMKVSYLTNRDKLDRLLPPGFSLRGDPVLSISCAWFRNLYWLAGRSYGILSVDFPVTYEGKTERIEGNFCPVIWEGQPEAIMTGRDELGFPKLFANFTPLSWDQDKGVASCQASWFDHTFCDINLTEMVEDLSPKKQLPGSDGKPQLYYKYVPRTNPGGGGGADAAYATTAAPPRASGGENINFGDFSFRRWVAKGEVNWRKATFEQLPLTFHIVNAMADLDFVEFVDAEMVAFSGPGIGISTGGMRPIEPA